MSEENPSYLLSQLVDYIGEPDPDIHVLVEGPRWGDAEFLGKWLLAGAEAERLWKEAYEDESFEKQVDRLCVGFIPDFGLAAARMIMHLKEYRTTFVLDLATEDGECFAMMIGMGFFAPLGMKYQLALPTALTATKVRAAMLRYASTEDEECVLHPEHLVTAIPLAQAKAWQARLHAIENFRSGIRPLGNP